MVVDTLRRAALAHAGHASSLPPRAQPRQLRPVLHMVGPLVQYRRREYLRYGDAHSSSLKHGVQRMAATSPRYPQRLLNCIASASAAKTSPRIPSFAACRPSPASRWTFVTRACATSSAATCTAALDCAWLHRQAAAGPGAGGRALAEAAPGHRLLVLDALRPHRVQIELWDFLDGTGLRAVRRRPGARIDPLVRHGARRDLDRRRRPRARHGQRLRRDDRAVASEARGAPPRQRRVDAGAAPGARAVARRAGRGRLSRHRRTSGGTSRCSTGSTCASISSRVD